MGRESGGGMYATVISKTNPREIGCPIFVVTFYELDEHVMHRTMHTLAFTVALGVVTGRT